jgi:hypothetical protein
MRGRVKRWIAWPKAWALASPCWSRDLSPDVIVLIGEVTSAWERVGPIINETVKRRLVAGLHTRIMPTDPRTQPRLRGAIALVLQEHFSVPQIV